MKILHSADWHLDSPMGGFSEEQAKFLRAELLQVPDRVVTLCKSENCDLLLLAGDLFDGQYTKESLLAVKSALEEVKIPVFISPGNHDFCHFVGRAIEDYQYKWENLRRVQPHVKENLYFDSRIIGGVNIVTLDDGYYLFSKGQEEMLRAEAAKGYPILLCMHVPLYTPKLAAAILEHNPCAYVTGAPREIYTKYPNDRRLQQNPDRATLEMIDYIKSEPMIKAIIAGHVHLNFEEPLDNGVPQICTHGGYKGYARELILT